VKKQRDYLAKRAVLYARVSGDDRGKEGRNLIGQIEMCREFAQDRGWSIIEEIAEDDRGASGASFELPELSRIIDMAHDGAFDVMVVREIDRLSRKLAKQLIVEEELTRNGVEIAYVMAEYDDTPEGRLNKHIRATIAEFEREKINERMVRGRRQKVRAGSVLVGKRPPFAYRVVEKDGMYALTIHEPEAQIIRLIYTWYTIGDGDTGPLAIRAIARGLNEMGVQTPQNGIMKGKKWGHETIRRFLSNETYAGKWTYGKTRRGKKNSPDKHLSVKVPAIVSAEVWRTIQVQLIKNRKNSAKNARHEYLMQQRLVCGKCGNTLRSIAQARQGYKAYRYYSCHGRKLKVCDLMSGNSSKIDEIVWNWVKSIVLDGKALEEGLDSYQEECEVQSGPLRERLGVVMDLIANNEKQLDMLLDLYLSGDFTRDLLTDRKSRLETTIVALEKEREKLIASLDAATFTPSQLDSIREFANDVAKGLDIANQDFKKRKRIVELLNVSGALADEDDKQILYLRCILGQDFLPVETPAISG
jgi:site-specific DNA recombinase